MSLGAVIFVPHLIMRFGTIQESQAAMRYYFVADLQSRRLKVDRLDAREDLTKQGGKPIEELEEEVHGLPGQDFGIATGRLVRERGSKGGGVGFDGDGPSGTGARGRAGSGPGWSSPPHLEEKDERMKTEAEALARVVDEEEEENEEEGEEKWKRDWEQRIQGRQRSEEGSGEEEDESGGHGDDPLTADVQVVGFVGICDSDGSGYEEEEGMGIGIGIGIGIGGGVGWRGLGGVDQR